MSDHSITSLIEKLEAASEGSRELDAAIIKYCDPELWLKSREEAAKPCGAPEDLIEKDAIKYVPAVSTSIDSAMEMIDRLFFECAPGVSKNVHSGIWSAWIGYLNNGKPKHHAQSYGKSAPLAVCIAVVQARAQSEARV